MLLKTSSSGDSLWSRTFGTDRSDNCASALQTSDGGYVLGGNTGSPFTGAWDIWMVRTGPELSTMDFPAPQAYGLLTNYPNPFNSTTTFEFSLSKASRITLAAYDILGRDAGTIARDFFTPGFHRILWTCPSCPSGVYFVVMSGEEFRLTQKAMLLR